MTNSTADAARTRTRADLVLGILGKLTEIRAQRFIVENDDGPLQALDDILDYLARCEDAGTTPVPDDIRGLIATALGVSR